MKEGFEMHGEMPAQVEVRKLAEGLGFGQGDISAAAQEQRPGNEDLAAKTDAAVRSPQILVPVDRDENGQALQDDGCGDGRPVLTAEGAVFTKDKRFNRSLHRPKVFGGGATMATVSRIGLGLAAGRTLNQAMRDGIGQMADCQLDFGAHIDSHAHDANGGCGCGAIDKAPLILDTAVAYRSQIAATINALGVETAGLDEVLDAFAVYARETHGQPYEGRQVMGDIIDCGKIVKELAGDHLETRIILNTVEGATVDQQLVREQTGGRAQLFAVDVWRLKQLAERLYKNPTQQQHAFMGQLVYTLATAGVLTKGDLPVYLLTAQKQAALAV